MTQRSVIRRATIADLEEIKKLFSGTISSLCAADYNEDQLKVWLAAGDNTERWIDKVRKQYFLIAEIDVKIVGFGSLENGNHLDLLYVHKNYQRQGIAKAILLDLEREATQYGSHKIHSDVSKTARSFFEKNGFIVIHSNINKIRNIEMVNYEMVKNI